MVLLRSAIYATTAVLGPADALEDVTLASLVPTQLQRLLGARPPAPRRLRPRPRRRRLRPPAPPAARRLRAILLGGPGASRALLERAVAAGLPVAPTYGL